MARWRLTTAHYIFTDPPTEWEYREVSRETGRQNRMVAKVPRLLDPKDPADWNYQEEIIVTNGHGAQRKDIKFLGEPTPDMEPLDDEAKAITKHLIDSGAWTKPSDGEAFGEGLIKQFLSQIAKAQSEMPATISASAVDPKAFADLQEQVKTLMEQNSKLLAQVMEKSARRV